jgi:mercuric reductase
VTKERFDLIVLGGGSAARDGGQRAARDYGANVVLVESTRWGGSCPNVACKPTKAYLVAADLVHDVNELAEELGIETGPARANLARVKARKDSLTKPQERWVEDLNSAGLATVDGQATFVDAHTVRVGARELESERILIATGSRTFVPPIEGLDDVDWIDHVSALDLTELPESLLVVGGGPVGLEFAQIFARFGSRVTVVQSAERLSPRSDAQAVAELAAAFEDEGIEVLVSSSITRVAPDGTAVVAGPDGAERTVAAERVLLASGRVPNVESLGLDQLGVETTRSGIVVDDRLRTSVPGIWAAGDVTGLAQFTPVAQYQARIAVDDMFAADAPRADYSNLPTAIFTDPELAGIGVTEEEARRDGLEFDAVVHPIKYVQRASYTNTKHGLYKLIFERGSRRVIGVHVVCRGASDVVQGLTLALRAGATIDDFAHVHHAFPTWGEGVKAAAEQALPKPTRAAR